MPPPKHVALLLALDSNHAQRSIEGILRYARRYGRWTIHLDGVLPVLSWDKLAQWNGDGIIAAVTRKDHLRRILKKNSPVVNIAADLGVEPLPTVCSDSRAMGKLAAEHLLSQSLTHFACLGDPRRPIDHDRFEGFQEALAPFGHSATLVDYRQLSTSRDPYVHRKIDVDHLAAKLKALPKPVGLFTPHDDLGFWAIRACQQAEIHVPFEVAVVGINNHELLCESIVPQLTSIVQPAEEIGFQAAAMLDRIMNEGADSVSAEEACQLLPPETIVVRASSDRIETEDQLVAEAIRFIRNNANVSITVEDVLDHVPVSRRSLEVRFKAATGRTIKQEIRRGHMTRAKMLLTETDWAVDRVARESGYESRHGFSFAFEKEVGLPPGKYRSSHRKS